MTKTVAAVLEKDWLFRKADSTPLFIMSPRPRFARLSSVTDAPAWGAAANMLANIAQRIEKFFMIVPVKPVSFWLERIAASQQLII
jgi:hypothetical protein